MKNSPPDTVQNGNSCFWTTGTNFIYDVFSVAVSLFLWTHIRFLFISTTDFFLVDRIYSGSELVSVRWSDKSAELVLICVLSGFYH